MKAKKNNKTKGFSSKTKKNNPTKKEHKDKKKKKNTLQDTFRNG